MKIDYEHPGAGTVAWFIDCVRRLDERVTLLEGETAEAPTEPTAEAPTEPTAEAPTEPTAEAP